MINLTQKAAKRFNIPWKDLPDRLGDYWKVDIFMAGRIPMLLAVHEYTLFTLVRRKSGFKTIEALAEEIRKNCPWYRYDEKITAGKNTDRRISGSINEMKRMMWDPASALSINRTEMMINSYLFSYLSQSKGGYNTPFDAVELYVQGKLPNLQQQE